MMPKLGTPNLFSFWKPPGNSPSRDIRKEIAIRSTIAVFTADKSRKPKTILTAHAAT